ncbi:hypothetical protein [Streptomyces sp. CNQ-509]|uniref:hypothetical protein n=1 Tax=Streptomyces sp. CNQ-509 TaxID=444103 RepID=UPI000A897044|nr:hypothetical protein [Streptomyces sp. CNQ-509]
MSTSEDRGETPDAPPPTRAPADGDDVPLPRRIRGATIPARVAWFHGGPDPVPSPEGGESA